jgi:23S rRNA (guanosine2251-2'-O)-methyltransferase
MRHVSKKPRKPSSEHWIWGRHAVEAALLNPDRKISTLYTCHPSDFQEASCQVKHISMEEMNTILPHQAVHQGVAVCTEPLIGLDLSEVEEGPILALDHITDPHNVGAIWRSAAAFGFKGILLTRKHVPVLCGTVAKSASGALEKVPAVFVSNLAYALEALKKKDFFCLGLSEEGEDFLQHSHDFSQENIVLILGAEGPGLRRLTKETCDLLLRLPTQPHFGTLNVSAAAAISCFLLRRAEE